MGDLLQPILLIVGFFGSILAAGWILHRVFSWIANRLPWRKPPSWAVGSSLPPSPPWAVDPYLASYRRALRAWGTTIVDTGEEHGMGWKRLLFRIDPAVAGVSEVMTTSGYALFTPGLRCMVVVDRAGITVLDREKDRGVRLEARWPVEGVRARLEGTSLHVHFFRLTHPDGNAGQQEEYSERLFSIDLHAASALQVVPAGWPGGLIVLPKAPRDAST